MLPHEPAGLRMSVQKIIRDVHGWAGAVLTLYVLLVSATGTLLLWKESYLKLVIPEARVDFTPTPEALAPLAASIEQRYGGDRILQIQFPTEDFALAKVVMYDANYAYVATDGTVIDEWVLNERWEEWLYDLHHRLLLDNFGLNLNGALGIALLVLVVLGVIAFWPLWRGFSLRLWPRSGARPLMLRSHRNIGILIVLPFTLLLVTGVLLSFPYWVEEQLAPIRGTQEYSDSLMLGLDDVSGPGTGDWLPAMKRALATFPDGVVRTATVPGPLSSQRVIGVQQSSDWHPLGTSSVYIDAREGWMDVRIDSAAMPAIETAFNSAYPLHTARLNMPYRLLMTACGVGVVFASIFGLLAFLGRFRKEASSWEPRTPTADGGPS